MEKREESQSVKDKHFEKLRKGIQQELLSAKEHFNIISGFLDAPNTVTAIMRKYLTFFYYTHLAHAKLLCISLYNVTKHNEQTSNIPRLLCYIRFHPTLSKKYPVNAIDAIENKLKSHATFLEDVVYVLRDQYYAHNQTNRRKLEKTSRNIRDECQLLLPDLERIYTSLSLKYDRTSFLFKTIPSINITELLTDLTEYKKIRRMDRKRWLRNTRIKVTDFGEDNRER